jgi:carbon monoxide dehydrogenase subunit G
MLRVVVQRREVLARGLRGTSAIGALSGAPEEAPMTSIRRQISVACEPAKVFAVLADVERLAEFSHMTVAVTGAPGRPLAVGDHFHQIVKVLHVDIDTEWEVTEVAVDQRIRVEGRSMANGSATISQTVALQGDGSLVTFDIEYEPPFGILGDIADRAVFEQRHEHDAEQILMGLKTLCEGVSAR